MEELKGTHGIFNPKLKINLWHAACKEAAKTLGLIMVEDAKMISIYNFNVEVGEDGSYTNIPLLKCKAILEKRGIKVSAVKKVSTEPHINIKYSDCSKPRKKFYK